MQDCLELEIPKEIDNPREKAEFLMKDKNMKGHYLGACLDSCRWGSQMTVMWEMGIKNMVNFIQNWMKQNENNYQELFNEKNGMNIIQDLNFHMFIIMFVKEMENIKKQ